MVKEAGEVHRSLADVELQNVIRDERQWKTAVTTTNGSTSSNGELKNKYTLVDERSEAMVLQDVIDHYNISRESLKQITTVNYIFL